MGTTVRRNPILPLAFAALLAVVWLSLLFVRVFAAMQDPASLRLDSDDALRMVEVRDLLKGQPWFDLTQYRMTPPAGVAMHWSRLIDAPLAGMVLLFRTFAAEPLAESLTASVWPTLLLLPTWLALGRIAQKLAGEQAALVTLLLAMTSVYPLGFFEPGEIDHHNAQLALTFAGMALLLEFEQSAWSAAACAIVNMISLGIGVETLPYVFATCLVVAAQWTARGPALRRSVRAFGIALAMASVCLLFGITAYHERNTTTCDTFSGLYAILAVVGGFGLAGASILPLRRIPARAAIVVALVLGLLVLVLALAPQCMRGPYAMLSPELDRIWLSRVEEAQPALLAAGTEIGFFFVTYLYAVAGLAMSCASILLVDRDKRMAAGVVAIVSFAAVLVTTFEIRGLPFAILAGIPGIAAIITRLAQRAILPGAWRMAAMAAGLFLFGEFGFLIFGNYLLEGRTHVAVRVAERNAALDCMGDKTTAQLAMLPRGRVASLVAASPAILLYTDHAVMAASYHRDAGAILDLYRLFTEPSDGAAAIIRRYGVDYLMTCRADEDYTFYIREGGPRGLLTNLDEGRVPSWLSPFPPSGPRGEVRVYKVIH